VALSDEQNAMLRLLASGEQSYGDIAALMGLSEEEVRAKVVGALAQLQAEGKPAPDVPPPVVGGTKPAAEATAPEPEPAPPKAEPEPEPVVADAEAPKAPATPAPVPTAPPAATPPPASSPPSGRPSSAGRTITLPSGRGAWLLGGGIVAAVVVIVVVILLVSGGGSDSSTPSAGSTTTAVETGSGESGSAKQATQAELTAIDGSEAAGLATFGRVKNKLALQIEATGLEPTTEGTDSYTIWLAQSPQKMIPLASTGVKGSGKGANAIASQFEVPVEVLSYLAKGTFDQIDITRTRNAPLEAAIKVATKRKTTPAYTGEPVLRGTITGPIVGIAKREEEEQGE
jgi:hypothetical protein